MRLDRILVTALGTLVLVLWLRAPVHGPVWPIALALTGAVVFLLLARRVPWPAPPPSPARPAVLIPTYNNHRSIGDVVTRAVAACAPLGIKVYVVDDGSTDGSGAVADDAGATVFSHAQNRGKGAALLTGMKALARAGCTHAICLDADGQHHPEDIPAFVAAVRADPWAIHAGVRDLSTAPGISRFGRRFSNFWIWVETGWRVADSQCGFRAYPLAPVLALDLGSSRYDLEVEVLTRALWSGIAVRDLPCLVTYPPKAERVTSFRPFVDNTRITWVNIKLIAERILWPAYWFPRPGASRSRWDPTSRGFSLGWRLVLGVVRGLGRKPATLLARAVSLWYVPFAPRAGLQGYLARVLPQEPAWRARARIYGNFAEALVDRMAWAQSGPSAFRYEREGAEVMVEAFKNRQGAILLSSHAGNIECAAGPDRNDERVKILHILRFAAAVDYGQAVLASMDPKWRPHLIAVNRAEGYSALTVLRVLREGGVVAMHGDRLIDERIVTVDLLGAPCRVPAGPWLLAALARVPVIVVGCFKEDSDTFQVVSSAPMTCVFDRKRPREEQIAAWAQAYADQIGTWVTRWPHQWYNFHDLWSQEPGPAGPVASTRSQTEVPDEPIVT